MEFAMDEELEPQGDAVVNYYFPVLVEVVGAVPDTEVRRMADFVFAELDRELATRV